MTRTRAFFCAIICCWVTAVTAEDAWFARSWQTEDGLPNNNVNSLAQTPDGFLWVATPRGLARFDGARFQEISLTNQVGDANRGVRSLLAGRSGGLWLQMDRGAVVHLQPDKTEMATPASSGLVDLTAQEMVETPDGSLWLSYLGGQICWLKDGSAATVLADRGLPFAGVSSVACDTQGRVWLARAGLVGVFQNGRFRSVAGVGQMSTRLAKARAGGVWVCSGTRLFHLDDGVPLKEVGSLPGDGAGEPSVVFEDSHGAVWVGMAYTGLFRYDGHQFEKIPLSHKEIACICEDSEGDIWVGTHGGGLNRLRQSAITLESVENGLPPEDVRSVCEDPAGRIWAVTENGLLVRHDDEGWTTMSTNVDWPGSTATCVAAGPDGAIWVGTRNRQLNYWKDGNFRSWGESDHVQELPVSVLMVGSNGDLWVGGNNRTLQFFRDGKFHNVPLPEDARAVRAIVQDRAGAIWVGTSRGLLLRVTENGTEDEMKKFSIPADSIRCLYATPDGSLWIGYAGAGLGRLKDGRLTRITTERGLFDDYISQIVSDGRGDLWFGSDRGLFKAGERELAAAMESPASRIRPIHYGRGEGLPSLQADFGYVSGAICSRDGRIWMPTRSALVIVDPHRLAGNPAPPPVRLLRMAVDGQDIAVYGSVVPVTDGIDLQKAKGLQLAPAHRKLEFDFAALSFSAPENIRVQYWLEGFDPEWIESDSQRHANYPQLPAGEYRFHVRACNNDGAWSQAGTPFAFTVTPFLWQRWWVQALGALFFAVMMIVVVRYVSFRRLRSRLRLLEQQAALDKERARIARDLHDDLGGHLTEIVMLSDLMLDYRAEPEKAGQTAERVSTAARRVVKSLDETVWAVNPRHDTLSHLINYIGPFAVEFLRTAGIRCRPDLPLLVPERNVSTEIRHNLFLVVKEALNNVVNHSQATEVQLRVTIDERSIGIVIQDNGRGFEAAPAREGADGLANMRGRIEEIGGRFELKSEPGAGTCITVAAPLKPGITEDHP